jgi:hypothetical protein
MLKMVVVEPIPRASARVARVRKAGARSSWRAEMSRPFMHGLAATAMPRPTFL